jgi:glutaconate CoA-transferase subunit A
MKDNMKSGKNHSAHGTKVVSMREAIELYVPDDSVVICEGFTHLIPFAAGHEIIRQGKKGLTLCRMTPDLLYDQMIGAGCARKVVFSWAGNPGVGSLYALRRAVEQGIPHKLEIEEYSHFGMVMRMLAGAANLPFVPLRDYYCTNLPKVNSNIREIKSPYSDEVLYAVPPLNPDVAIIHAQRADCYGNAQVWGVLGVQKEAAFASRRVIVTVEEIVSEEVIRSDPNRTVIPGLIVNAVVEVPFGSHPSYAQGYYDRDNEFYVRWNSICRDEAAFQRYLDEWVYGVEDRADYVKKLGAETLRRLTPLERWSEAINYGTYQ